MYLPRSSPLSVAFTEAFDFVVFFFALAFAIIILHEVLHCVIPKHRISLFVDLAVAQE
jgi:hypothetical protein